MSKNNLLDRELYRKIKNMDKNTLNTFIQNIYNTGNAYWTIVNKVDKQKSKIYRKFTSA